ncbi:MAG: replication-associated recombination protein A [Candidatus Moranbacteria bacterium]|nr:replication-associated recombination protein A [Candidatus Moranbacteria bacterium]
MAQRKNPTPRSAPLADRMRPRTLGEFFGQEKLFGEGSLLRAAIEEDRVPSLILWGPPGSGKTTLATIVAHETSAEFEQLSAVGSGVKEFRGIVEVAERNRETGKKTILFIDEIHRWNKSQQDALLPHVERGLLTLIGATTENPSFEVNAALLSRARVVVLEKLSPRAVAGILGQALADERGLAGAVEADQAAIDFIAEVSAGDARMALNTLEACAASGKRITAETVEAVVRRPHLLYDKGGEEHYNIISALHKSMRGGDADAALYWLARMLEAGEDPLFVARRLVRFASEDVGLANSFALPQAIAAYQACQYIGMPECELALAQAVTYLAKSKKSNALYVGYGEAKADANRYPGEGVPLHLRNAPTRLMKDVGYGKGYKYTPDFQDPEDAKQDYLPERLKGRKYVRFEGE